MVSQQIIDYVKTQKLAGYSDDNIKNSLIKSGWPQLEIDSAFTEVISPQQNIQTITRPILSPFNETDSKKPKIINIVSILFFILAAFTLQEAYTSASIIYVTSRAIGSVSGALPYAPLKAIPFVWFFSIPGMIAFVGYLYAGISIRSGSRSGWRKSLLILLIFSILSIFTGVLVGNIVKPLSSLTQKM